VLVLLVVVVLLLLLLLLCQTNTNSCVSVMGGAADGDSLYGNCSVVVFTRHARSG
jgi:hypothetical protein